MLVNKVLESSEIEKEKERECVSVRARPYRPTHIYTSFWLKCDGMGIESTHNRNAKAISDTYRIE